MVVYNGNTTRGKRESDGLIGISWDSEIVGFEDCRIKRFGNKVLKYKIQNTTKVGIHYSGVRACSSYGLADF